MKLNQLTNDLSPRKNRKRVGRGIGSGTGKTCGSGHKGQKARSGVSINGFEGGQMPIYRRVPKRGFVNIFRKPYVALNLGDIQSFINSGKLDPKKAITKQVLVESGIVKKVSSLVKVLSKGELTSAVKVEVDAASASAVKAVKKLGGTLTIASKEKKSASKEKKEDTNQE